MRFRMESMNFEQITQRLSAYERLMRLDKPIGILLLLWPTLWGLWLSAGGMPSYQVAWIFVLGTVLMRSAGCVMNDLADMRFDGQVERTRHRPLVTGVVSRREALVLAAVLALAAFALVLFLNRLTLQLSVPALLLAASYPFTKRFFALPQAYLGIAFGFGIPMAYAAQLNQVPPMAWWLLLANVFWAIAYDTEYAMVDRDDDVKLGLSTAAITFGRYDVFAVMSCYASMLIILAWVGLQRGLGLYYFAGLTVAACIMSLHYRWIRDRSRAGCFRAFLHNNWVGAAIFGGIALELALGAGNKA